MDFGPKTAHTPVWGARKVKKMLNRNFAGVCALCFAVVSAGNAQAQNAQQRQATAQAAQGDKVLSAFYKSIGYETIWTGRDRDDRLRRRALLEAFESAEDHGLPVSRYDADVVEAALKKARKPMDRGRLDVELSKQFLSYARDVSTGVLDPRRLPGSLGEEIARRRLNFDSAAAMKGISKGNPDKFLRSLAPKSTEYAGLMAAKIDLERTVAKGGWGPKVPAQKLALGDSGSAVVALRNRLIRMGYLKRTVATDFNQKLADAVLQFQSDHGLAEDGVVGSGTLAMINTSAATRLSQVIVAMERERWMNFPRGNRHIEVNIPDYHARVIDNGRVTFVTRAVVGRSKDDHRTPEFSDKMEYLVFNPSWYVPRGIATAEYLPMLQEDPFAVSHLQLLDDDGQPVDRLAVDFASLDEDTWPFWLKEPPSQGNALGLVKFMFPNRHNIYLHDTPQKSLFGREMRAYSHGCIRLADPFGFANEVLSRQSNNTEALIRRSLAQPDGEYHLGLKEHIPVHLIYRTARVDRSGNLEFRNDIYGRDAAIFKQLQRAGVELIPGA